MDSFGSTLQPSLLSHPKLCSSWSIINNLKIISKVFGCLSPCPTKFFALFSLLPPAPPSQPSPPLFFSPLPPPPLLLPSLSSLLPSLPPSISPFAFACFPSSAFLSSPLCISPIRKTTGIEGGVVLGREIVLNSPRKKNEEYFWGELFKIQGPDRNLEGFPT